MAKFSKEEIEQILGTDYPDNPLEGGMFQEYRNQKLKDESEGHTKCGTDECCMKCKTADLIKKIKI